MKVLGIVGSPRGAQGLGHRVVMRVLEGARAAGAETEIFCLMEQRPEYCTHCGHRCFELGDCAQDERAAQRSQLVSAADALVLSAPVYVWQVNGLTAAFLDKLRLTAGSWVRGVEHGRPALGIAVAGGSGTGVFPALQALYSSLCHWKYRPFPPLPVTRFNLERACAEAFALGQQLAQSRPLEFQDTAELLMAYDEIPFLRYGHSDEFRWLAEQVAAGLATKEGGGEWAQAIRNTLAEGYALAKQGDAPAATRCFVAAYRLGLSHWA
jgi:multimeric flavodoxin WrbA